MAERRRYTRKEKVIAITSAIAKSQVAVAKERGIPETTLSYWMRQPEFAQLRIKQRADIADDALVVAQLALHELARRVKSGGVEPKDLAIIFGITADKAQLLGGHATDRVETRELNVFDDHETRAIVEAARQHLAGDPGPQDQALAAQPAVEGAGAE